MSFIGFSTFPDAQLHRLRIRNLVPADKAFERRNHQCSVVRGADTRASRTFTRGEQKALGFLDMSRKQIFEFVGRAQEETALVVRSTGAEGRPAATESAAAASTVWIRSLVRMVSAQRSGSSKAPAFRFVFQCNETGREFQHSIRLRAECAGFERFAVRFRQKKLRRVSRKKRHQSHCVFIQTGNRFRIKKTASTPIPQRSA